MFAPAEAPPSSGGGALTSTWAVQLSGALLGAFYLLGALWGISCGLFSVGWDLVRLLTGRRARVTAPSTALPRAHISTACTSTAPTTPEPAPRGCVPAATTAKPPGTPTPAEKGPAPAAARPSPLTGKPTKAVAEPPSGPVAGAAPAAADRVQVEVLTEALLLAETEAKAAEAAEAGRAWLARHEQHQPQQSTAAVPAPAPTAVLEALVGSPAEAPGAAAADECELERPAPGEQLGAVEQRELGLERGTAMAQDDEQSEHGGSGSGSGISAASFFTATSADPPSRRSESPVTPGGTGGVSGAGAAAAAEDCEPSNSSGGGGGAAADVEKAAPLLTSGKMAVEVEEFRGGGAETQVGGAARPAHKRSHHGHRRGAGAKGGSRS